MGANFDEVIGREGTNSIKYDLRKETFGSSDLIPLWVADMDFKTPSFIIDALSARLRHEILGYSFRPEKYFTSIMNWMSTRHGWKTERDWISFCPGIVPALNLFTLAFTGEGDTVIVQPPVYFPFFSAVEAHGRKVLYNRLVESEGKWMMDFDNLRSLADLGPKMIIISNPHNPVGRVWTQQELSELVDICSSNGIIIISDEIHCDLIMPGFTHTPLAKLSEKAAGISVTCIAPSKTFNLAGLSTSSVIIPDKSLRKLFTGLTERLHITNGNIFGTEASIAAYEQGAGWLDELVNYIDSNAGFVEEYCLNYVPEITPVQLEATYLLWLDCRRSGMNPKEMQSFFSGKARVGMNEGSTFGPGGEGFMRMNIACPRSILERAMNQIENAFNSIR